MFQNNAMPLLALGGVIVLLLFVQYVETTTVDAFTTSTGANNNDFRRLQQRRRRLGSDDPYDYKTVSVTLPHPPQRQPMTRLQSDSSTASNFPPPSSELEQFLQQEHGMFYALFLNKNEHVWKTVRDSSNSNAGCTIFAPTNDALQQQLDTKKIQQLQDNRNEEVRNQMGSYHFVINDIVTTEQLYDSGGIRTIATGDTPIVPIERTKTSGNIFESLLGGGKEDGTVTIGTNAHIVNTIYLQNSNTLVHQTDALISPTILWRYCDQLRIPGSK
jgi:uncharacterized surface protein with fasciclin (FAS1) repeats